MLPHSDSHCFIFRPEFQSKVWKRRSRSPRSSSSQRPQSGLSHPLDCSPHNHIKRSRKSFFFFFYCCCVFPLLNNALPPQGPWTAHQLTSAPHPTLAISFSSSGRGPLPRLHPIVWAKAARVGARERGPGTGGWGPGPVQTRSSLSLDQRQPTPTNLDFLDRWRPIKDARSWTCRLQGPEHPSCVHAWRGSKFPIHQVVPEEGQPVCVCHRPLSGRRAGACSPDEPPPAEEVLLRIGLFVAR